MERENNLEPTPRPNPFPPQVPSNLRRRIRSEWVKPDNDTTTASSNSSSKAGLSVTAMLGNSNNSKSKSKSKLNKAMMYDV